jgi:hypothetical protein
LISIQSELSISNCCDIIFFFLMFKIVKGCFSLLSTMIFVINHFFKNESDSPLVCFHPYMFLDLRSHLKMKIHELFIICFQLL